MKASLELEFSETINPDTQERHELSLLCAHCKEKDGFAPGIRYDTGLNALKGFKPWLLAKAVGEDGRGRIVGAACVFLPTSSEAEISACVDPLFRGQGIFAELFKRTIHSLREAGVLNALLVSDARLSYGQTIAAKLGIERSHTEKTMTIALDGFHRELLPAHAPLVKLIPITQDNIEQASGISACVFDEPIESSRSFISACLEDPTREPLLAIGSSGAVGTVSLAREDEAFIIHGLGVVPDRRRRGYGKAILDTVLNMLNKRGGIKVSLDVDELNRAAMALYESRGFAVASLTEYWRIDISKLTS